MTCVAGFQASNVEQQNSEKRAPKEESGLSAVYISHISFGRFLPYLAQPQDEQKTAQVRRP